MIVCATVEVDARGRGTLPVPSRKLLGINGMESSIAVHARVEYPESVAGRKASFENDIGKRGRITIPADEREQLGVDGIDSLQEWYIEVTGPSGEPSI